MSKNQDNSSHAHLVGWVFVLLGILLLATLLNIVNAASIYGLAVPILFLLAGYTLVSFKDASYRQNGLGLGMIAAGVTSLLVRFDVISGKTVNAVLGVGLLLAGIYVMTHIADKHAVNKSDD